MQMYTPSQYSVDMMHILHRPVLNKLTFIHINVIP